MRHRVVAFLAFFLCMGVFGTRVHAQELIEVGQEALQDRITGSDAVTVVNFWATWCGPCREEFPDFVQLGETYADDVEVLFVSMDFPDEQDAVRAFLQEQGWEQPSFLRVGKDNAFIRAMHDEWTGVLPATLIYTRDGTLVHFSQGNPLDYDTLVEYVRPHL